MTLPDLIHRHRAYLARCTLRAAPWVRREIDTMESAAAEIRRLREENELMLRRYLDLLALYETASKLEEFYLHQLLNLTQCQIQKQ
jgi:hypothetical protein